MNCKCGALGQLEIMGSFGFRKYRVECPKCFTKTGWADSEEEAIEWFALKCPTETTEAPNEQGNKFDDGKLRMDLIPSEALFALAEILGYGAEKYGDRNWEKGLSASRLYAATQRHLVDWWGGEPIDSEAGFDHLWHAMTNLVFMVTLRMRGKLDMEGSPYES
jgi:hypothetical protein